MTVKEFGTQFNLSEKDMLEVLVCMNAFSDKLDNWLPKYYEQQIVNGIDSIIDEKRLKKQVLQYHDELSKLFKSRITSNCSARKIIQKANLKNNITLKNFAKADLGDL